METETLSAAQLNERIDDVLQNAKQTDYVFIVASDDDTVFCKRVPPLSRNGYYMGATVYSGMARGGEL